MWLRSSPGSFAPRPQSRAPARCRPAPRFPEPPHPYFRRRSTLRRSRSPSHCRAQRPRPIVAIHLPCPRSAPARHLRSADSMSGAATRPRPHTPLFRPCRAAAVAAARPALPPAVQRAPHAHPTRPFAHPERRLHSTHWVPPVSILRPGIARSLAPSLPCSLAPCPLQNSLPADPRQPFAALPSPWSVPSRHAPCPPECAAPLLRQKCPSPHRQSSSRALPRHGRAGSHW